MENPKKVTEKLLEALPRQPQIPTGGKANDLPDEQLLKQVNKIFTTLKVSYPAWYEKYYGDQRSERLAKRIWLTGIKTLTGEQVDKGLQRMVLECEYPPKLKDFITLCLPLTGVPSPEIAWYEVLKGVYSHVVVKVAAELTGIYELRHTAYDNPTLKKRFEYYLSQVVKRFIQGEALTDITAALGKKTLLDEVEYKAEQKILKRIKEQGINTYNARRICLALLGIKRT